jgi:hypothetical protein
LHCRFITLYRKLMKRHKLRDHLETLLGITEHLLDETRRVQAQMAQFESPPRQSRDGAAGSSLCEGRVSAIKNACDLARIIRETLSAAPECHVGVTTIRTCLESELSDDSECRKNAIARFAEENGWEADQKDDVVRFKRKSAPAGIPIE